MSILVLIIVPVCWALAGKLAGLTIAASCFFSVNGKRAGKQVGGWLSLVLPTGYLLAAATGLSGNAGYGFTLFGSERLFDLACGIPVYAVPVLGVFAAAVYIVRDLTLGHTDTSCDIITSESALNAGCGQPIPGKSS